ncbi:MAG: glycosyltransferase family 2 protein [Anaerolineae bacterium]|nr:glycosyltransferase family 2 protein [Anaerolineae bacterium]
MAGMVSIIIVNWNGKHHLQRCLSAVLAQTYSNFEVILVDNGSTDGSAEFVSQQFPQVRLIRNAENLGFAKGNNIAFEFAQGDYIATLNNDTQADPHWLSELMKGIEGHPRVGMCASKMLFYHHPHIINSTGINLDRAGIAWDRRGGEEDQEGQEELEEVFGPCAGAALYKRQMLEEIGFFDEDFFAYLEDVDLAWRARLMGWRSLYVPTARVYHLYSATGREGSPYKNYLLGRNKIWTVLKNYPAPEISIFLPVILFYDCASVLYALLARRDANALKGRIAGWRELPKVLAKRKEVQGKRSISFSALAGVMSPLENPFKVPGRYRHLRELD